MNNVSHAKLSTPLKDRLPDACYLWIVTYGLLPMEIRGQGSYAHTGAPPRYSGAGPLN